MRRRPSTTNHFGKKPADALEMIRALEESRAPQADDRRAVDSSDVEANAEAAADSVEAINFPHVANFLDYMRVECGLATNSVESYCRDICAFVMFMQKHHLHTPEKIGPDEIGDYLSYLYEEQYSPASRARMLVTIRLYFRFLISEKIQENDPCAALDNPKLAKHLPQELSPDEVEAMLHAEDGKTPLSSRNRAIIEVFYATGARVSEVCAIRKDDVELQEKRIRLRGKGGKQRMTPLGLAARQALAKYIEFARPLLCKDTNPAQLLLSRTGKPLRREDVFRVIKAVVTKAGIGRNVYPHLLRHSFATHMLAGGANLRAVQMLLGHADIATTEIYTHVADDMKFAAYHDFHPHS